MVASLFSSLIPSLFSAGDPVLSHADVVYLKPFCATENKVKFTLPLCLPIQQFVRLSGNVTFDFIP